MKLKILTETAYDRIEEVFNKFSEAYHVLKVDVFEINDLERDTGYITYHVFYQDKPWSD